MRDNYLYNLRDIKPENIIFVSENSNSPLKVIDFGTSRKFNSEKNMTKKLGTVSSKRSGEIML